MVSNLIPKLRFHRALEGLDDAALAEVAAVATIVEMESGDILYEPEQLIDALHLVMKGRLRVVGNFKGSEQKTLRLITPGESFGALGIVINQPLPCTVTADQPTTTLSVPRDKLSAILERYPQIRENLSHSVGSTLRASLLEEEKVRVPRFVAWIQFSPQGRAIVSYVAQALASLDESVSLLSDATAQYAQIDIEKHALKVGDRYLTVDERSRLIGEVSDCDRVMVDVDGPAAIKDLEYIVDTCDVTFWVAAESEVEHASKLLRDIVNQSPSRKEKMRFVCVTDPQTLASKQVDSYRNSVDFDFKIPMSADCSDSRVVKMGVRRLVHHLRGVRLGIALGGGAARGMAHLGVLKVLEQAGICFDMMSGTSAGALVGVPYAMGFDADYCINSFQRDLRPGFLFRMLPKGDAWYLLYKYRTRSWDGMLRNFLSEWTLQQLAIPFSGVSVDLVEGKQVIYHEGDAVRMIVESINLPGISAPICRDGMALIDGGTLNVLPADVLISRGCDYVVAVNVSSMIKHEFGGNRADTPTEKMRTPGIRATLSRERVVQDRNMNAIGSQGANFVIRPDISDFSKTDFPKTTEIANVGARAAEESLDALRESLNKLDPKLFPLPS